MKIKFLNILIMLSLLTFAGCGGGGGGGGAPQGPAATVITGVASKGPISGGTVRVFAIRNGSVDRTAPLGTPFTPTPADGSYSINIATYTGPVLVEVTGGTYTDEATGAANTQLGIPLRAYAANVAGSVSVAVTAVTEVAARKIDGGNDQSGLISPAVITNGNNDVALMFGVADIIGTSPAQLDYALALATVSRFKLDTGPGTTLGQTLAELSGANLNLTKFVTARTNFIDSPQNLTGIAKNTAATSVNLTLSTQGTLATGTKIGALDLTINIPPGIPRPPMEPGTTNQLRADTLQFHSSVPADTNRQIFGSYSSSTTGLARIKIGAIHSPGFGVGPFATLTLPKTAGSTVTLAHFILTGLELGDFTLGSAILGLSLASSATFQ